MRSAWALRNRGRYRTRRGQLARGQKWGNWETSSEHGGWEGDGAEGVADSGGIVGSQVISRLFSDDVGFSLALGSAFALRLVLT